MATVVYPGRYDQLSEISKFVEEAAEKAGFSDSEVYSIQLAVDEACVNIIDHAYGGEGKGEIVCTCETDTGSITITLQDFGRPFNPDETPLPRRHTDLNNATVSGLGLFFMRQLMDEIEFNPESNQGNVLRMTKFRKPYPEDGLSSK